MGIKEDVERYLNGDDLKAIWNELYYRFEQEGKDGVKRFWVEKADKIKEEFTKIQEDIKRHIGG